MGGKARTPVNTTRTPVNTTRTPTRAATRTSVRPATGSSVKTKTKTNGGGREHEASIAASTAASMLHEELRAERSAAAAARADADAARAALERLRARVHRVHSTQMEALVAEAEAASRRNEAVERAAEEAGAAAARQREAVTAVAAMLAEALNTEDPGEERAATSRRPSRRPWSGAATVTPSPARGALGGGDQSPAVAGEGGRGGAGTSQLRRAETTNVDGAREDEDASLAGPPRGSGAVAAHLASLRARLAAGDESVSPLLLRHGTHRSSHHPRVPSSSPSRGGDSGVGMHHGSPNPPPSGSNAFADRLYRAAATGGALKAGVPHRVDGGCGFSGAAVGDVSLARREAAALASSLARQGEVLESLRASREGRRSELEGVSAQLESLAGWLG